MQEIRKIDWMKVRQLCIEHSYYTCGTNKEYENLLFVLCNCDNATLPQVKEIAEDILKHSNWEKEADEYGMDYSELLIYLMETLLNECCRIQIRKESISCQL